MKNPSVHLRAAAVITGLLILMSASQAQNREKFGISAKAGGVNSVAGNVTVVAPGEKSRALTDRDDLTAGDVVTTGQASQVEILLNPGSYLRVGPGSEFAMVNNALDNLTINLIKGSTIIEATGGDGAEVHITVLANQQHLVIIKGGIYRFNVQTGLTELLVRKGRVVVNHDQVKGGMKVKYASGAPSTSRLSKQDQDDFDLWSRKRADTLARANARISGQAVNGYLAGMSLFDSPFLASNPWGLWTYSDSARCFTFLPFHYGWSSPYGHYFGSYYTIWPYSAPGYGPGSGGVIVTNPNSPSGPANGFPGGGSSGGSSGGPASTGNSAPIQSVPSQAGPRDPDGGGRAINRIKDPVN